MIFYEQPTDPWVPYDFMLLEAYQRLQDEICPRCGHPVWLCRSDSNNVEFLVKNDICHAERALKEHEVGQLRGDEKRKALKEKASWGRFTFTVPSVPEYAPKDTELPTRAEYYESITPKVSSGK